MTRANKNTTVSNHEPIQLEGVILIAGIMFFAALATVISIYFNDYKLNISCEKKRPDEIAICQIVKVNLLDQKTVLFDDQPITTANILGVVVFNRSPSAVSNNFQKKLCKAQLYGSYGEVIWKTQHSNEWWKQNCFGYDDSGAFIDYLENQEIAENRKLNHNYQLVIYKHWDKYLLSFLGWAVVCSIILIIYCHIRLGIELRKMSQT
ncbi:hypothetical protein JCM18903_203 [Psychrobacter sp. JCM 18903]|jgi:hypothetical protein|uniref:hypothetical protein n=1 Tax=Psychrobacter TaxID=497 RepID=UPI0004336AA3|nr:MULTISPECIES: hypothetical protein [Psychrobacter]GAF60299.1 hypothetical protein JCM18903_203 [Psychrobacter sp. JCM 18903]